MKKLIVLLAAVAMVGAFVATAMADVSLYGSARFGTYWEKTDFPTVQADGSDTDSDLDWRMWNLSRFGAKFKSDKIGGRFEMDARVNQPLEATDGGSGINNSGSTGGNMRLRLLYGTWNFGSGEFLIGQNYPLYNYAISGIAWTTGGLQPWGGVAYAQPRVSQMRFTFGEFRVALLTPNTKADGLDGGTSETDYTMDVDTTFPKIEASYTFKTDMATFNVMGGYQSYKINNAFDQDKSINSYVVAAYAKPKFGPAYLNLALSYRVNGGNYGVWTKTNEFAQWNNGDVQDATTWGFVGALGYKINDMFTLEGSLGYLKTDYDSAGSAEDKAKAYGVLCKINVAKGVLIQPEWMYLDQDERTAVNGDVEEQPSQNILGVWWKIDFK